MIKIILKWFFGGFLRIRLTHGGFGFIKKYIAMRILHDKRSAGRYYTRGNPFALKAFGDWADSIGLAERKILEPFAGANHIIYALQNCGWAQDFAAFDIDPEDSRVKKRDVLRNFPKNYEVIITNPPWLAKNSAKRRGLPYPDSVFDDLYKHCLKKCLENAPYVAALIPASYLQSGLFRDRLQSLIFLHDREMFRDTDNPVALALFMPQAHDPEIYHDDRHMGSLSDLQKLLPEKPQKRLRFNDPEGALGFIAFDNTRTPSIGFCKGEDLRNTEITHSTRMITRIALDSEKGINRLIDRLNHDIATFRHNGGDIFLTPFKGLRQDGHYRRRMDYALASGFIGRYL